VENERDEDYVPPLRKSARLKVTRIHQFSGSGVVRQKRGRTYNFIFNKI
jgi:hypothetical protein